MIGGTKTMTPKNKANAALAATIIKNLEKRNMEGFFCTSKEDCVQKVLSMIPNKSEISWGGSMSVNESGMMTALQNGDYILHDRAVAATPKETKEMYVKAVMSDFYFMSTNAITIDGELINIDGNGNRVACLIHGPSHIMMIVGMNKVVSDVSAGVARVRNLASPANAIRLNKNLACAATGRCADCLSPECFCNQLVITRRSGQPERIKVFLVDDILGY